MASRGRTASDSMNAHPELSGKTKQVRRKGAVGKGTSQSTGGGSSRFMMVDTIYGAGQVIGKMVDSVTKHGSTAYTKDEVLVMVMARYARTPFEGNGKPFICTPEEIFDEFDEGNYD